MALRLYPAFVTLLGGVGLGLALTYFVGIFLAFRAGMEAWAQFFVAWAIPLLIFPYLSLIAHMVLRNHVGRFLLGRGAYGKAVVYGRRRAKATLLRSKREASNQCLVWVRGLIGMGAYEEAQQLLGTWSERLVGDYWLEAARWRVELALREDDRERAEAVVAEVKLRQKTKNKGLRFAQFRSTEAELALRQDDEERYRECMLEALWAAPGHRRAALSRALAMVQFDNVGAKTEEILQSLHFVAETAALELPARSGELKAMEAKVLWRAGRKEEAHQLVSEAAQAEHQDRWSQEVIAGVEALIEG